MWIEVMLRIRNELNVLIVSFMMVESHEDLNLLLLAFLNPFYLLHILIKMLPI